MTGLYAVTPLGPLPHEDLKECLSPNIGRRVLITSRNHPWYTHAGAIAEAKHGGYVVALDDGFKSMVWVGDFQWQR